MYYSDNDRPQDESFYLPQPQPEPQDPPARPAVRKKRVWPKVVAAVLCCAILCGLSGVGGALLTHAVLQNRATPAAPGSTVIYEGGGTPTVVDLTKVDSGQLLTPAQVYAANVNSVVGIVTHITTNVWGQQVASAAAGSGFVLSADGYIVTNYHVVEDASSITVQFKNGDKFDAVLVGGEAENDVAVLKIDAAGLTPVRLGSSDDLVVGQDVVAIGNPLGEMTFSMTRGIVSALDKALTMSDGRVINVLQTDTAINSGNSGGPLLNLYGQVVGITNAKYSNNGSTKASIEGICFAIPIDDVKSVITDLIEHGYVTGKPYVGVTLATVNAQAAAQYGRSGGAYVQSLVPGAAGERAGLKKGDIITAVDGEEIDGHAAFIEIKSRHRAGDTVTLTVDREGRTVTVTLTFDEARPGDQLEASGSQDSQGSQGGQTLPGYGYGYNYDPFGWLW